MEDKAQAMVLASFVADSLALGVHWIYDVEKIDREFGIIDQLTAPAPDSYHPQRTQGEFTHYGDQALLLLRCLSENNGFNLAGFAEKWQAFSASYDGYLDHATKSSLQLMAEGKGPAASGSSSTDLGGPARIAPLVYCYRNNLAQLLTAAQLQTAMTHTGAGIRAGTDFIAQVAYAVLHGSSPSAAIEKILEDGVADIDLDLRLRKSIDSVGVDTRKVIGEFGQMCAINAALPGAIHLVLTYENNLQEALIQNVMAGGDSAARGMVAGMILGAHLGMEALPPQWLSDLKARDTIVGNLQSLAG